MTDKPHTVVQPEGYVPDASTAIKIAIAVWEPIYGAERIAKQKPFRSRLENDVWVVQGSLPSNTLGGVAVAEISKIDGRVIHISHGR